MLSLCFSLRHWKEPSSGYPLNCSKKLPFHFIKAQVFIDDGVYLVLVIAVLLYAYCNFP
uniref:Uncharacterized protein n=1 Tax=Rhizophora mucronata TaxID=61149 RepID=A0A2P2MYG4_RHIMU